MKSILNENEKQKLLKLIFWDKTGFWLAQKRLERNTWPWPDLLIEKMKGKLSEKDHYPNIRISCRADRSTVYAAQNSMFYGSGEDARSSCWILTMIETAKIHNISPEDYLPCYFIIAE